LIDPCHLANSSEHAIQVLDELSLYDAAEEKQRIQELERKQKETGDKGTDITEIMTGSKMYAHKNKNKNVKPPKSLF
jgi:hypothetical protein